MAQMDPVEETQCNYASVQVVLTSKKLFFCGQLPSHSRPSIKKCAGLAVDPYKSCRQARIVKAAPLRHSCSCRAVSVTAGYWAKRVSTPSRREAASGSAMSSANGMAWSSEKALPFVRRRPLCSRRSRGPRRYPGKGCGYMSPWSSAPAGANPRPDRPAAPARRSRSAAAHARPFYPGGPAHRAFSRQS